MRSIIYRVMEKSLRSLHYLMYSSAEKKFTARQIIKDAGIAQ